MGYRHISAATVENYHSSHHFSSSSSLFFSRTHEHSRQQKVLDWKRGTSVIHAAHVEVPSARPGPSEGFLSFKKEKERQTKTSGLRQRPCFCVAISWRAMNGETFIWRSRRVVQHHFSPAQKPSTHFPHNTRSCCRSATLRTWRPPWTSAWFQVLSSHIEGNIWKIFTDSCESGWSGNWSN